MAANVMFDCFFGQSLRQEQIEGVSPFVFLRQLANDVNVQNFDLLCMIFGTKFLELGLRQKDRDISRRLRVYEEWGRQVVG